MNTIVLEFKLSIEEIGRHFSRNFFVNGLGFERNTAFPASTYPCLFCIHSV